MNTPGSSSPTIYEDATPDNVYVNGAVIILTTALGVLDININFSGIRGYSNSLTIIDKDEEVFVVAIHLRVETNQIVQQCVWHEIP